MTLTEFKEEATKKFGPHATNWKFKCPSCGTIQSFKDFIEAGETEDAALGYMGFSCIGRFVKDKGCDWTLGGLLHIHTLEIKTEDGKLHPRFELANVTLDAAGG